MPLRPLFRAIEALDSSRALLVGLDFDGTLSPIAPRPELAQLPLRTKSLLARLSRRAGAHVAVISGRALDDVRLRVGLDGLHYAGNHGLEIAGPLLNWRHPTAAQGRAQLKRLVAHLRREIVIDGVLIEEKDLSLSVHYRLADPSRHGLLRERVTNLVRRAARRYAVSPGHMVWEVRPRARWNKARALQLIAERLKDQPQLVFVGDDRADEEAFKALGDRALSIRVGGSGPTAARFRVDGPAEVRALLEKLCRFAARRPA